MSFCRWLTVVFRSLATNTPTWKGTGCVKITPAHDFNDYEVGKRHALPMINILTFDGDIRESAQVFDTKGNESDIYSSEIPAEFQKLERFAARKAVVAAVDALGLLEEIKPHDLTVPYGDRGGVVIETDADRPVVRLCRCTGETSG